MEKRLLERIQELSNIIVEDYSIKKELDKMGVDIINGKAKLYRGSNVPKEQYKPNIKEDVTSDTEQREEASEIFENVYKWLKNNIEEYKKRPNNYFGTFQNIYRTGAYMLDYGKISYNHKKLYFQFRPEDKTSYVKAGLAITDSKNFVIVLNILLEPNSLKYLDTRFYSAKDTVVHELIHYLDNQRFKSTYKSSHSAKKFEKGGMEAYVNTPEEFNAWFQEMAYSISRLLTNETVKEQGVHKKILDSFVSFVHYAMGGSSEENYEVYKSFNKKYKNKFIKRMFLLYKKYKDEFLEESFIRIKYLSGINEDYDIHKELIKLGAEVIGDKVKLYRGGNVPKEQLKNLRYNDFLSTVKHGVDAYGNTGASSYGKNVVTLLVPIKYLKFTNGEIQYQGPSSSLKKSRYPLEIYKAYNDYYGSNYTSEEINKMDYQHVRSVASMGLSGGREEFNKLVGDYE